VVAAGCHNLEDAASAALVKSLKELLAWVCNTLAKDIKVFIDAQRPF
jgi:hypothetical protein